MTTYLQMLANYGSAEAITDAVFQNIQKREENVCAYLSLLEKETAFERSRELRERFSGSPVAGLPIAVKDNICTSDFVTTCASRMLANFRPPYDATVVNRLKAAGALIIGKTNMDEFAMGSSTENSAYKVTKNPHDLTRVPGGTSGGAAAAVAAGEALVSIASDTGGSIRQPAAFCGVTGFKPTYGAVSRYGLIAYASSLDQIGVIGNSVHDVSAFFSIIAGPDELDSTSIRDFSYNHDDVFSCESPDPTPLTFGIPEEYFTETLYPVIRKRCQDIAALLEAAGHRVIKVSLPHTNYAIPTYYIISSAEASSNLARYDGSIYGYRAPDTQDITAMASQTRANGFGAEVKRRIMIGTHVLSAGYYDAYYMKALKVRTLICQDFKNAFEKCDVLLSPVAPTTAFKLGQHTKDPLQMYLQDIYSVTANLAGLPALSLPCGPSDDEMPIGVQLTASPKSEPLLFRASRLLERIALENFPWNSSAT